MFSKSENDRYIKNYKTYTNKYKILNINYSKSQKIVYDNILKFKKNLKYEKQLKIYLKTLKILDKIKEMNRK